MLRDHLSDFAMTSHVEKSEALRLPSLTPRGMSERRAAAGLAVGEGEAAGAGVIMKKKYMVFVMNSTLSHAAVELLNARLVRLHFLLRLDDTLPRTHTDGVTHPASINTHDR